MAARQREAYLRAAREQKEVAARDQYLTDLAKRDTRRGGGFDTFISTKRRATTPPRSNYSSTCAT